MPDALTCPKCLTTDELELGNYHIHTTDAIVEIYYAICNVELDHAFGSDYCGFFIVREEKELIVEEIKAQLAAANLETPCGEQCETREEYKEHIQGCSQCPIGS